MCLYLYYYWQHLPHDQVMTCQMACNDGECGDFVSLIDEAK